MKPDPLRIELRRIGGGFADGPSGSFVFDEWGVLICHAERPQELMLATGDKQKAILDAIARIERMLENMRHLQHLHQDNG